MSETRKQIAFDLDTNALKTYYPSESWNNAYEVIRNHMKANGFQWLQGSVYVSDKAMPSYQVAKVLDGLIIICLIKTQKCQQGKKLRHGNNRVKVRYDKRF